ncbi:sulfatase family protein [Sphingobacterium arenae]|uniref:Sulfatase n=1 Tax=Sphingobacterium arenae TaxID=1280598 RepID=A0ABR7XYN7_9SPHI|nr:sulfatase [Sphingobacterium arenae]MBD1424165.1 sulfatase [Sphingobacterium arenae]
MTTIQYHLKTFLWVTINLVSLHPIMAQTRKRPNIIFIFSDDHAFQAISAYNGPLAKLAPTPNIDRIGSEGMRFDKCYVTNSLCTPSRASVLTGTHSHINGVKILSDGLNNSKITFPMIMKCLGYQTALVGKWHLKSKPQGFNYWEVLNNQGEYYNPDFITSSSTARVAGYATDIITDKALNWLQNGRDKAEPFLLMIHHKAPHRSFEKGPDHLRTFEGVIFPEPPTLFDDYVGRGTSAKTQEMMIGKDLRLGKDFKIAPKEDESSVNGRMTEQQRQAWNQVYDSVSTDFQSKNLSGKDLLKWKYQRYMKDYLATVCSVDDNVGRVLDYLDKNGLAENTLVVYSSDQGFYLGEHGWFDKRFMYEESFRTPLLMRWPETIKKGAINTDLVSNLDFAQTFIELAGGKSPEVMQGLSLVPVMKSQTPNDWRTSLYYHYYDFHGHKVQRHEGVANKNYKLIHFYDINEWELYDLRKDPQELTNQYDNPAYPAIVKAMKAELQKLKKQYEVESVQTSDSSDLAIDR